MSAPDHPIFLPGEVLEKVQGGFTFIEGTASSLEGDVFFTDQPNDRILKLGRDGQVSAFMEPCGRANGMCFDEAGNLWVCADEKNELRRISPFGNVSVIVRQFEGKLLNGPNDVWVRPAKAGGGAFFSDPFYKREYWQRGPMEQDGEHVYYVAPDQTNAIRIIDDLQKPNGIIGSADSTVLYVTDIGANRTFRYSIQRDGTVSNAAVFCEKGSDGMTIDEAGNLYLTGNGVSVFTPNGEQIAHIAVPGGAWTGNVCFGGSDMRTLYVAASDSLYRIRLRVCGVGSQ